MLIGNLSVFINCDPEKHNHGSASSYICVRMGFFSNPFFLAYPFLSLVNKVKETLLA